MTPFMDDPKERERERRRLNGRFDNDTEAARSDDFIFFYQIVKDFFVKKNKNSLSSFLLFLGKLVFYCKTTRGPIWT
jgi:hypothetical protein